MPKSHFNRTRTKLNLKNALKDKNMDKNMVTLGFWAPQEGSVYEPPHMSPGFFGSSQDLSRFQAFWKVFMHEVKRNATHFSSRNMPCFAKPNAFRFKENTLFQKAQRNSLQRKRSILRNPTQFALRKTRYSEKPNAIRFKENAIFWETQRNSLQAKCDILRNPTQFASREM